MAQCAATNKRTRERCRSHAIKGKNVCRHHGGLSPGAPKGNKYTQKHGLYSNSYDDDFFNNVDEIETQIKDPIKALEDQLRLALSQQQKIVSAQELYYKEREEFSASSAGGLTLTEIHQTEESEGKKYHTLYRQRDFSTELKSNSNLINRLARQIHDIKKDLGIIDNTEKIIFNINFDQ